MIWLVAGGFAAVCLFLTMIEQSIDAASVKAELSALTQDRLLERIADRLDSLHDTLAQIQSDVTNIESRDKVGNNYPD